MDAVCPRRLVVEDLFDILDFEVVVAGAERASLLELPLLRPLAYIGRVGACYPAALLGVFEVFAQSVPFLDYKLGAIGKQAVDVTLPEAYIPGGAYA